MAPSPTPRSVAAEIWAAVKTNRPVGYLSVEAQWVVFAFMAGTILLLGALTFAHM